MQRQLVYDLPTRLFHWVFSMLFLFAFIVAKTVDDESIWFSTHSLAGLFLGFIVILRIIWGFWGTQHARFSNFKLNPVDLINYFKGLFSNSKNRWAGHNPASSWAAVLMIGYALGLSITGYLMTSGSNKENFEDAHELFANGFIIIVVLHIAGIILHSLRHNEMIAKSMIDGKKENILVEQQIQSSKSGFGILFIGLCVAFGLYLFKNYDNKTRHIKFFGQSLQLGEENNEHQKLNDVQTDEEDDE